MNGLQLDVDARTLKAFKALATGQRAAKKTNVKKEIKAQAPKESPLPGVMSGLHLLVSLQRVDLVATGVIPGMRDCPLSSRLQHMILHNRCVVHGEHNVLGDYDGYAYGSPCGFTIWQNGSEDRQVPGLDGLARLQRTEEAGMCLEHKSWFSSCLHAHSRCSASYNVYCTRTKNACTARDFVLLPSTAALSCPGLLSLSWHFAVGAPMNITVFYN